jgi:hypothetical protein
MEPLFRRLDAKGTELVEAGDMPLTPGRDDGVRTGGADLRDSHQLAPLGLLQVDGRVLQGSLGKGLLRIDVGALDGLTQRDWRALVFRELQALVD